MIGTSEQDAFISRSFAAIASTVRKDGTAATSMIFYGREGDRLLFSTVTTRLKGRTLARDPRITLTVLNNNEPNSFVSVEGTVVVHTDNAPERREQLYRYWDRVTSLHAGSAWRKGGRESTEILFTQPGRAIYEVIPTRVSGELLDQPVELGASA
jgi:PPOX class probable F420-dependent enzyme